MKVFEAKGEFSRKGEKTKFSKTVKAENHKFAAEKVLCLMGSKHKLKRRQVVLIEIKEAGEENGRK